MNLNNFKQSQLKEYMQPYVLKMFFIINLAFLIAHSFLTIIFGYFHINIMFYINIISIILYSIVLITLNKTKSLNNLVYIISFELISHMILAVVCMGWSYGFQIYSFGIIPIIIFFDYLNKTSNKITISSIILTILTITSFFLLRIWTYYNNPIYDINNQFIEHFLYIANTISTIIFISIFIYYIMSLICKFENILYKNANFDTLTGLANRRVIQNKEDILMKNEHLNVSILDIDDFKHINDTYGHNFGDEVLKQISLILKLQEKKLKDFTPIRYGGEEFLLIYNDDKSENEKLETLNAIRNEIQNLQLEQNINVTVTLGTAFNKEKQSFEDLIKLADKRLYFGKENGKNQLVSKL